MKSLLLIVASITSFSAVATAGPERSSAAETKHSVVPSAATSWFADNEWTVGCWGAYASTGNDYRDDRYINADHAWGGGVEAKYFFRRYFGVGLDAGALDARRTAQTFFFPFRLPPESTVGGDHRFVPSLVGTFTLRYPLSGSRFSPYVFGGAGAIFGGGEAAHVEAREVIFEPFRDRTTVYNLRGNNDRIKALGQFGGGIEVRLTPHIGLTNDVSWSIVDGPNNNFAVARTGIHFAF